MELREVPDRHVAFCRHPVDDLGLQPDRPVHPVEPRLQQLAELPRPLPPRAFGAPRTYDRLVILRCTKKLLAVLGAGRAAEPGPAPDAEDWYASLLWFGRRKCLLLTHAATLFSIFEADVRAVDLRATHRLVTELVERELRREGLPPTTLGNLRSQELILARTADRSVLGCMNDMAFLCEMAISDAGGLAHIDLGELNHALHGNINSSRGYRPPVELAAQQLERGQSSGQETGQEQAPPS